MRLKSPQTLKFKMKKKKKNKIPNNQRQDLPILSFLIHISHCYRGFKLRHFPAKHIGSSLKLIKRSRIVDFNPPILECISFTQRWISTTTNSTWQSLHWTGMPHTIQAPTTQIQPRWTPFETSSTSLSVFRKNQSLPCS